MKPLGVDTELIDRVGDDMEDSKEEMSIYQQIPTSAVLEAVQDLSPAYQTVFNLYVMEGYTHIEISELLNISVGTSKSNLSKARLNLQKMLQPLVTKISQLDNE